MEFTHIISHVPQGEYFDASAINNEGVWLSVAHLQAVENALAANKTESLTAELNTVQEKLSTANSTIEQLNATITEKQQTIDTHSATISSLEAKVSELGAQSSGAGSGVKPVKEELEEGQKNNKVSFDSDEHPANVMADKLVSNKRRAEIFDLK